MPRTMKLWTTAAWTLVLLTALGVARPRARARQDRDPLLARHDRTARRRRERAGEAVQREPERVRGEAPAQGDVPRDADRGHRGVSAEESAAHRAGLRGRHPDHDAVGRRPSRLSALGGAGVQDRLEGLHRARGGLLLEGRQSLLDALQLLHADPLLQQGRVRQGRARSDQAAADLEAGRGVQQEAHRLGRRQVRVPTGWPSWTMVENMHAWHDQPFATKHNGFDGLDAEP